VSRPVRSCPFEQLTWRLVRNGWKVGAVVEPGVRGVAEAPSDEAIAGRRDALLRPPREPSPAAPAQSGSEKKRRNPRFGILRVLKRLWIPLVIVVVLTAGGLTVSRLHGAFGNEKHVSYADTRIDDNKPALDPKHLTYEVFGPPGTLADISYFDVNGEPQFVHGATLPWSLDFAITGATAIGDIAAQGDGDTLGCRIAIDGEVKAEKTAHEVHAFAFCLLKSA
jgi:hypothetical protein